MFVNKPKNYITKIYPMPENNMRFPQTFRKRVKKNNKIWDIQITQWEQ